MTNTKLRYNFQFYNSMQTKQCSHVGRRTFPCDATNLRFTTLLLNQKPLSRPTSSYFFCAKKNPILLVLPFEEISIRPELSSPPCFRIEGGSPERDKRTDGRRKSLCLILDIDM